MSAAKFPLTALALERDLAAGCFREKLPNVPALAARYGVSPKVMQRSMRLLAVRKIITPTPRGTLIGPEAPRRRTGTVSVFCAEAARRAEQDPLLCALAHLIRADGLTVSFLEDPADETAMRQALRSDCVMFVYSTFRLDAFRKLRERGIGCLAANRLPGEYAVSQVCWDHRRTFETILYRLVMDGVRDILFFLAGRGPEVTAGSREITDDLIAVEKEFQFAVRPTLNYVPEPESGIADFVEFCRRRPVFPDAIICWGQWEMLMECLERDGRMAGRDYTLVRRKTALDRFRPGEWRSHWLYRFARTLWEQGKQLLADPSLPHRVVRVPYPAQTIEYLIARKKK